MSNQLKNQIIWNSFRDGSIEALETIYEENYSSLFHYGVKFTPNDELIKDLIHELFIELIDAGNKLSPTDNIRFYLLKALRYKILHQISEIVSTESDQHEMLEFSLLESIEHKLIQKEVETEIQHKMMTAIQKLSRKQQEIIYLRFYDNVSYSKIAEMFDVKIQTVRNLMNRAMKSLKDDLESSEIRKSLILLLMDGRR
ncbi:MAG TPA: sigma-70 family RNA polymerase sigma factor [Sunxiuqinia sp.]|nr:sigma-70 family RNA polymerase sigma factor [Sunxiuqinia sp.]